MIAPPAVAVAASGLGHIARGIEAWADDLATALHARGVPVTLYKGGGIADRPFERVVPCLQRDDPRTARLLRRLPRRLSWRAGFGAPYPVEQTTFGWNLVRRLRREPADILHVQDPLVAVIAQRARKLRLIRTRTILAHGTEEPPSFLRRIEYLQHLAPWHLEQVKAAGVWKPTWTAIPNFIDADRFRPGRADEMRAELGIPADAPVVLTAAAIKRGHKRIDHLVREFAAVADPAAVLVVAGGREAETDDVIAEGMRLLGGRVRFLVRFPRVRMPDLYRAADLFVLASLFEMMPIALIEAAASGLPCVTHAHPIPEWMTGPGGVPTDMARPGALTAAMTALLADPARRQAVGRAAREHAVGNFACETVVADILAYYDRVLTS